MNHYDEFEDVPAFLMAEDTDPSVTPDPDVDMDEIVEELHKDDIDPEELDEDEDEIESGDDDDLVEDTSEDDEDSSEED